MADLTGKHALVTGGARGIGRAIVERLAGDGASVLFTYRTDDAAADEVVASVTATGGRAESARTDMADTAAMDALFDRVDARHGGLDIYVHSAATNTPTPITEVTPDGFDQSMAVNVRGPFFALQRVARTMRDGGRIVTISSLNTVLPGPGLAMYASAKAAMEQVGAVAARELGSRGITVNTVSPGATDTDLLRGTNPPATLAQLPALTALGRLGTPADIADVVAFLAGPDARWITGQNLRATGGLIL